MSENQTQGRSLSDMKRIEVCYTNVGKYKVYYERGKIEWKNKEGSRNNQRKMAFIFNFVSYLAVMVIGYCVGCNKMLQWIFNAYFLSVLVLTIVNNGFKIKASGHACSCTLPYLILTYYFSGYVTVICLLLYLVEFWASIELKRHTVKEFLGGTIVAWVIFAVTFCMM